MRFNLICFFLLVNLLTSFGKIKYEEYFSGRCLRIDYYQSGTRENETVVIDQIYSENSWGGNPENLIDTLNRGMYLINVFDLETNRQIYSYGFSTLFNEWQTTEDALNGAAKVIGGTLRIPFPKRTVRIDFLKRDKFNHFTKNVDSWVIDPFRDNIRTELRDSGILSFIIQKNGTYESKVDLVIVGEGYDSSEINKFKTDTERMTNYVFEVEPFKKYRDEFNITGVLRTSHESGTDNPLSGEYKNTALNSGFGTFGSQRYLMTSDNKNLNDIISGVPHDAIIIIINSDKYGGGGIYNMYAACVTDNRWSSKVIVHEVGHSFAGLGDEYYTDDVAYAEFYPKNVEPWEPNLTILSEPQRLKWIRFVHVETPLPTPWDKKNYDERLIEYYKKLDYFRKIEASSDEIESYKTEFKQWKTNFFRNHSYANVVGAFVGAGYASNGIYRPALECIMFSNRAQKFDPVCHDAIEKRILNLIQ